MCSPPRSVFMSLSRSDREGRSVADIISKADWSALLEAIEDDAPVSHLDAPGGERPAAVEGSVSIGDLAVDSFGVFPTPSNTSSSNGGNGGHDRNGSDKIRETPPRRSPSSSPPLPVPDALSRRVVVGRPAEPSGTGPLSKPNRRSQSKATPTADRSSEDRQSEESVRNWIPWLEERLYTVHHKGGSTFYAGGL